MSTNCYNPCTSCGNCQCTCSNTLGCLDIYDTSCVNYNGLPLNCFGVDTNTNINSLLEQAHSKVCTLIQNMGFVKVDVSDTTPKPLIDKLEAGANIILTGSGSGSAKKIRIDAVLNGDTIDEKVRVSPTDTTSSYLENKLIVGECMSVQKIGTGFDEKLKILVDWNCVLGKISTLAGFCDVVKNCVGSMATTCPSISLNSPAVVTDDVTLTWVSNATQFNVFVDGILLPGMPVGAKTYSILNLANGNHTLQVDALCANGSANTATTNVVINTTCPSAGSLMVNIVSGTAAVTWSAAIGGNVLDQTVQYKLRGNTSWTSATTVSAGVSTYNINGLSANQMYDFRILTNCSIGGPTPSPITSAAQITCPAVTLTPTNTTLAYSFPNVGAGVSQYLVELFNNTGTTVLQTKTESAPFASIINNTFSNLTPGTNYQVKVTVKIQEFGKECAVQAISTAIPASCPTPTGLGGTTT